MAAAAPRRRPGRLEAVIVVSDDGRYFEREWYRACVFVRRERLEPIRYPVPPRRRRRR